MFNEYEMEALERLGFETDPEGFLLAATHIRAYQDIILSKGIRVIKDHTLKDSHLLFQLHPRKINRDSEVYLTVKFSKRGFLEDWCEQTSLIDFLAEARKLILKGKSISGLLLGALDKLRTDVVKHSLTLTIAPSREYWEILNPKLSFKPGDTVKGLIIKEIKGERVYFNDGSFLYKKYLMFERLKAGTRVILPNLKEIRVEESGKERDGVYTVRFSTLNESVELEGSLLVQIEPRLNISKISKVVI